MIDIIFELRLNLKEMFLLKTVIDGVPEGVEGLSTLERKIYIAFTQPTELSKPCPPTPSSST